MGVWNSRAIYVLLQFSHLVLGLATPRVGFAKKYFMMVDPVSFSYF